VCVWERCQLDNRWGTEEGYSVSLGSVEEKSFEEEGVGVNNKGKDSEMLGGSFSFLSFCVILTWSGRRREEEGMR